MASSLQSSEAAVLSIRDQLLLAQAVHQVQLQLETEPEKTKTKTKTKTIDWTRVTQLLHHFRPPHSKTDDDEDQHHHHHQPTASFNSTLCSNAYSTLSQNFLAIVNQDQDEQQPPLDHSQTLAVARQSYAIYLNSIAEALLEEQRKTVTIELEIEAITRGEWDDKLDPIPQSEPTSPPAAEPTQNLNPTDSEHPAPPNAQEQTLTGQGEDSSQKLHCLNDSQVPSQQGPPIAQNPEPSTTDDPSNQVAQVPKNRKRKAPPARLSQRHVDKPTNQEPQKPPVPSPTSHCEIPQAPNSQDSDLNDEEIAQQLVKSTDHVSPPPTSRPPQSGRVLRKDRKARTGTTDPSEPVDPDPGMPPSKKARTLEDLSAPTIPKAPSVAVPEDEPSVVQRAKQDVAQLNQPPIQESSSVNVEVTTDVTLDETTHSSVAHSPSSSTKRLPLQDHEVSADGSHAGTPNSASFTHGNPETHLPTGQTPNSAKSGLFAPDSSSATGTRAGPSSCTSTTPTTTTTTMTTTSDPTSFRRRMLKTHSSVQSNPISSIFRDPVKESEAPGYTSIIKRPMDLRSLAKKLRDGKVTSTEQYRRDLMLMLANAVMFNHEDSEVSRHAKELMVECDRLVSIFMRGSRY